MGSKLFDQTADNNFCKLDTNFVGGKKTKNKVLNVSAAIWVGWYAVINL